MFASILIALAAVSAQPFPEKAAVEAAQRLVRETYGKELISEAGLSKVLDAADSTADDAAGQAAMYLAVAREATNRGLLKVAFDAVDRLEQRFEYDALAAKATMLSSAVRHAKTTPQRASLANRCFELLDEAIAEERFDVADDAAKVAGSVVPKLRDADLRKELAGKRKELDQLRKQSDAERKALVEAEETLKRAPNDAGAHETLGHRLASLGDWQRALPHLAKAADADLRNAAKLDAAAASDAKRQLEAADAWWDFADSTEGKQQRGYRTRAVYWYTLVMPSMSGLLKARAEKRIQEAGAVELAGQTSGDDSKVTILLAPGVPLVLVKMPASADGKVKAFWLGQTEVTEAQWAAVMGGGVSSPTPKVAVSFNDGKRFVARINDSHGQRFQFRLPTKNEMTAACGNLSTVTLDGAWMRENSPETVQPAAKLKANQYGLFDIVGNAWEWCADEKFYGLSAWDSISRCALAMTFIGLPSDYHGKPADYIGGNVGLRLAANLR